MERCRRVYAAAGSHRIAIAARGACSLGRGPSRAAELPTSGSANRTRIEFEKCMYTFTFHRMCISTSYYGELVQEVRVFRPRMPNSEFLPTFRYRGVH